MAPTASESISLYFHLLECILRMSDCLYCNTRSGLHIKVVAKIDEANNSRSLLSCRFARPALTHKRCLRSHYEVELYKCLITACAHTHHTHTHARFSASCELAVFSPPH